MHVLTNTRFPWYPHVNETYSRGSGSCQARLARSARQTSGPVKVGTWTARLAGPMARMIVIPMIVILQETWTESVGKKHLTDSHKKNAIIWPISSLLTWSFSFALSLGGLHHSHPADRRQAHSHHHADDSCVLTCRLKLSTLLRPLPSPWARQAPHLWLLSRASAASWAGMEDGWVLDCKRLVGIFCL